LPPSLHSFPTTKDNNVRRIERRRLRLAKDLGEVLQGVALSAAALAAGDARLATARIAKALEAGARLAETLAAMEASDYWRAKHHFGKTVREARFRRKAA